MRDATARCFGPPDGAFVRWCVWMFVRSYGDAECNAQVAPPLTWTVRTRLFRGPLEPVAELKQLVSLECEDVTR